MSRQRDPAVRPVNLAALEAQHAGLAGLTPGTGAHRPASPQDELAARALHEATPLARAAAEAYGEVLGPRTQRAKQAAQQASKQRPSTFL